MSSWIIYRGPLERSRLSFLLQALAQKYGAVNFIWIFPGTMTEQRLSAYKTYIGSQPVLANYVINTPLKSYFRTRKEIQKIIHAPCETLICIGFSSLWFSSSIKFNKLLWCINGIPEEKELTTNSSRIVIRLNWMVCKLFARPDLIIVVSRYMKELVGMRMTNSPIMAAPTCVDIATFRKEEGFTKRYFTYLGTGAAWQALDLLSHLWQEVHRSDPSVVFRVISRDPRARILGQGINSDNIEFVSSDDFEKVAYWLNEAEVGFLVRRNTLVNRVSFPTKLAEYLAAGAWVVSSDFNWEVKDYLDTYQCGILISDVGPGAAASILQFRKQVTQPFMKESIRACADSLDRKYWINQLKERLDNL